MLYNKDWGKPTTPSQLLREAANIMEVRGMAKGVLISTPSNRMSRPSNKVGSMCLQGAMMAATGLDDTNIGFEHVASNPLYQEAAALLAADLSLSWLDRVLQKSPVANTTRKGTRSTVADWNNNPRTTQRQAVRRLRKVARKLELA